MSELLTITEAAEYLKIPENTLRKWVSGRKVPHSKVGRHVRFTPAHLAEIVERGEQPVMATRRRGGRRTQL